jgi:hypothetical protein
MVTITRKFVAIEQAKRIFKESQGDIEIASMKLDNLTKRRLAPPPPVGGISIRAAERKYKIRSSTICGWIKSKLISTLGKGLKEIYIDESMIAKIAEKYHKANGRGNRAIIKIIKDCTTCQPQ